LWTGEFALPNASSWVVERQRRRRDHFAMQLEQHRFLEVCSLATLTNFAKGNSSEWSQFIPIWGEQLVPSKLAAEQLNEVIRQLEHPNYHLAILNEEEAIDWGISTEFRTKHGFSTYWESRGESSVLIQSINRGPSLSAAEVEVHDSQVVKAFNSYFEDMWHELGDCKSKPYVLETLHAMVNIADA
jgi:hypothetical protein